MNFQINIDSFQNAKKGQEMKKCSVECACVFLKLIKWPKSHVRNIKASNCCVYFSCELTRTETLWFCSFFYFLIPFTTATIHTHTHIQWQWRKHEKLNINQTKWNEQKKSVQSACVWCDSATEGWSNNNIFVLCFPIYIFHIHILFGRWCSGMYVHSTRMTVSTG